MIPQNELIRHNGAAIDNCFYIKDSTISSNLIRMLSESVESLSLVQIVISYTSEG